MAQPQDKPRERNPEKTRKAILDAAKRLIATDGSDAVSLSAVARKAGISRGTAYLHFRDRESLLEETISSVREELTQIIAQSSENLDEWDPEEHLAMQNISDTLAENAALVRVWLAELILGNSAKDDPLWQAWRNGLRSMRRFEILPEDIDEDVLTVIGLSTTLVWPIVMGADKMSQKERKLLAQRFAQGFERIILRGILTPTD